MRIRSVKPEFWKDEEMARLPYAVRLFYIGLWGCADDAGWFEWRPARIGADLFPYEGARSRERQIAEWGAKLITAGRLRLYEGCRCAEIPTLQAHQRVAGRQSFTYRDAHLEHSGQAPVEPPERSVAPRSTTEHHVDEGSPGRYMGGIGNGSGNGGAPRADGLPNLTPAIASAWEQATGRTFLASGNFAPSYLDDAAERHGEGKVVAAIFAARKGFPHVPAAPPLAAAVRAILDPFPSSKEVGKAERESEADDGFRRRVGATKRRAHEIGAHLEPDPACPACEEGDAA